MTGIASDTPSVETAAASLTSSLLARKGHAEPASQPAYDAVDLVGGAGWRAAKAAPSPAVSAAAPAPGFERENDENFSRNNRSLQATVKFRMSTNGLIRLRRASRLMKASCQSIINTAIMAYLDAHEIGAVDEETARQEAKKLTRRVKR